MRTMRLFILTVSLFSFGLLSEAVSPSFSTISVANAEVEGPVLKLKKAAKLHAGPSGPSATLEVVWTDAICIWLDKQGVWVQVRMKSSGRIGWIHHSYLRPASMKAKRGK